MKLTFQELAVLWCESKRPLVKHSTMCAYTLSLYSHLLPYFGEQTSISEAEAQAFVLYKLSCGLSRKTVRDMVAVLKSVVKYGGKLKAFPFEPWEIAYPTGSEGGRVPTLALRHQRILMGHLVGQPSPQNIGVLLALCTGMRIGEVCALRWQDVDLSQRCITVRQTVGRVYNVERRSTERVYSSPKTKSSMREIPISGQLLRSLRAVRRASASPYVVGTAETAKEPRAYRDYFARLLRRLGIPPLVFHGLRHTFATRCIESGGDYKTVSAILGHSNVATTLNLYVHPNHDQKRRCLERMSKYVGVVES